MQKIIKFFLLVLVTIVANYYLPSIITLVFFIGILIAYFYSKDEEGFWFAFFLVTADGFFGFFGLFEASFKMIPGLAALEIGFLYILIGVVKAMQRKPYYKLFFNGYLQVFFVYIIFLIAQGAALGMSPLFKDYLSLIKSLIPLALFYSLPRLLDEKQWKECFSYLFVVAIIAFAAQIFTLAFSMSPPAFFGIPMSKVISFMTLPGQTYRELYNPYIIVITLFAALYYLSEKKQYFKPGLLYAVIIADFLSVFVSAQRGYTLSFSFAILLFFSFVKMPSPKQLIVFGSVVFLLVSTIIFVPPVNRQVGRAVERLTTLESVAQGDLTAGGTSIRWQERGPRVLKGWKESPLTGLGYSQQFWQYLDGHVGNQSLLLHGGIVGMVLILGFFVYFCGHLLLLFLRLNPENAYRVSLLVFCLYFLSWFILHSSSRQYFSLHPDLGNGMIMVLFFVFGGFIHKRAKEEEEVFLQERQPLKQVQNSAGGGEMQVQNS